jgi:hypothetical protein
MARVVSAGIPAQRNFHAGNLKFEEDATLEVRTTFRRPDTIESQVLRAEGSRLIRERVFDNILKAENETHSKLAKQQVDIVPANYSFSYIGQCLCHDRKCYRCVFRGKSSTDSNRKHPLIPIEVIQ